MKIINFLNSFINSVSGYRLTKVLSNRLEMTMSSEWMKGFQFENIVDVGANKGEFSLLMRQIFPKATIYAFEPIPNEYSQMLQLFKFDRSFYPFQFCLGANEGMAEFKINNFSPASSLLPMNLITTKDFNISDKIEKSISVPIKTLDDVFAQRDISNKTLLKIDVQGFEDRVIRGGTKFLQKVSVVVVESCLKEYYRGQASFDDIYELLKNHDFQFHGIADQLTIGTLNEITVVDAIFIHKKFL